MTPENVGRACAEACFGVAVSYLLEVMAAHANGDYRFIHAVSGPYVPTLRQVIEQHQEGFLLSFDDDWSARMHTGMWDRIEELRQEYNAQMDEYETPDQKVN